MTDTLEQWWSGGVPQVVEVGGSPFVLFERELGRPDGPCIALLHGWPTSSWDWAPIAPALAAEHRVVAPDFLGLGASSKGGGVPYDIRSQADAIVELWELLGVDRTAVVAHDFGTIVTQELLARRAEGSLTVELTDITWLNGSLDPSRYRPTAGQLALLDPDHGSAMAALIDRDLFANGLAAVHGHTPTAAELTQHWLAMSRLDGHLDSPRFLGYIDDRAADAARLLGAFVEADLPMQLVWGLADPVSGAEQLDGLRSLRPDLEVREIADAGHYPHTERPDLVADVILAWRRCIDGRPGQANRS